MNETDYKMYQEALEKSRNAREIDIKMLGDRSVLINMVYLLGQIRTAMKSNVPTEITVNIGKNLANGYFDYTVNGEQTPEERVQKSVDIN